MAVLRPTRIARSQRELSAWRDRDFQHQDDSDPAAACRAYVAQLGSAGWLKYAVPRAYGGALDALDVRSLCLIRETLGYASGLAEFAFAMQGLGSGPISLFGSDALKRQVPSRRRQRCRPSPRSPSPRADAGSDVAAMQTTARRDGDSIVIDGEKTWISNAGIASHYVVFCRWPEGGDRSFSRRGRRRRHTRPRRHAHDRRHGAASARHDHVLGLPRLVGSADRRTWQGHARRTRHAGSLPHDRRRRGARIRTARLRRRRWRTCANGERSARRWRSSS